MEIMNINEYADFTDTVWTQPKVDVGDALTTDLAICALGMAGEVGEVVEYLKKYIHYGRPINTDALTKELGDVIFYWARFCILAGIIPSEVIAANIEKLSSRKERGVLQGEGSNR